MTQHGCYNAANNFDPDIIQSAIQNSPGKVMRVKLVSKLQATGIVLFISLLSVGCASQQVRPQALTPQQSDLSHVRDGLAILLVRVDGSHHVLSDFEILNLETQESFSHPFYDDSELGSSNLDYEQMGGENGALEHMVFLDIPSGKYQITGIEISDKGYQYKHPVSDMESIYFEFGPGTPAYLGELFVSLGKESRKGILTEVGEVFFMASMRPANNIKRIVKRYPMLQSLEIHQGKIWEK